jgi:hypothetical protein
VPTDKRPVHFQAVDFIQSPPRRPMSRPIKLKSPLEFTPKPTERGDRQPGDWRPLVVDISPEEVHVRWRDDRGEMVTLARKGGDEMRNRYEDVKRRINQEVGKAAPGVGVALPGWSPRMPFGVMASKASVAIRKVTVTPNP